MHYELTQRIDGGEIHRIGIDPHLDCLRVAMREVAEMLPMLGYVVTENMIDAPIPFVVLRLESLDVLGQHVDSCQISLAANLCDCEEGERTIADVRKAQTAPLN